MNIDTDTQWAFTQPIKKYMDEKSAYLQVAARQPRRRPTSRTRSTSIRAAGCTSGEKGLAARLVEAFKDLGSFGKFEF